MVSVPEMSSMDLELQEGVLTAWLNRPEKANAMDETLWFEIGDMANWADETPEVRVVVLAGRGRSFTAGIDFTHIASIVSRAESHGEGRKQEALYQMILKLQGSFTALESCRKPILAAIHGACYGGGIDLITACDMRYATEDARFSVKEVDLGIVADVGTLQRLPPLVGEGMARELALTGRMFDAAEAKSMGLLNQTYASQQALMDGATTLARSIAGKSPLTVRGIKHVMNYSRGRTVAEGLEYVATWNAAMLLSEDAKEATMAFMTKQEPTFKD